LNDPGHEVDIVINCSLKTMTAVWTCQEDFRDAVKKGAIEVLGNSKLIKKLQDWLCASPLSTLGTMDEPPKIIWENS